MNSKMNFFFVLLFFQVHGCGPTEDSIISFASWLIEWYPPSCQSKLSLLLSGLGRLYGYSLPEHLHKELTKGIKSATKHLSMFFFFWIFFSWFG